MCVLVTAAVLAGQLSIGWSNDRIDARRDAQVGRTDKPVARGDVSIRTTDVAVSISLAAMVGLSFGVGWRFALVHLAAVGCGWAYNVGVKATLMSWLPYAVAFGALPVLATLAQPTPRVAGWWAIIGAGCLGVAAHLANVLPDLDDDAQTGVRGLPHRLGARGSLAVAAALLGAATALITLAAPGGRRPFDVVALAVVIAVIALALPGRLRRPATSSTFIAIMAMAAVDLVLLATAKNHLR